VEVTCERYLVAAAPVLRGKGASILYLYRYLYDINIIPKVYSVIDFLIIGLLESPLHPGGKDEGRVQDQDLNQCLNKTFAG